MKSAWKICWTMLAAAVLSLCIDGAAAQAPNAATPVPKVTGPVPVSADSFPFGAWNRSQDGIDLPKLGYVEEEFFVSGTANVYDWAADGRLTVKTANAPYTTRIMVQRPAEPSRFSGTVIVEPLESGRGIDRSFLWAISHDYFIERGDAFVGISHAPGTVDALKKFNPKRYASLSMANPTPNQACGQGPNDSEEGLQWDIISQVGALLKSNASSGPLAGLRAQYVFGTSHGGELITYVNAVHSHANLANGKPVYDGYLLKVDGGPVRINRCVAAPSDGDPRQLVKNVNVPVIRVISQGDVLATFKGRRPDSDDPSDRYRLYEVAGASHMDRSYYQHLPLVQDQTAAGAPAFLAYWPLAYQCEPEVALKDLPVLRYALDAAYANLDEWARKGTPAPRADRIEVKDGGSPQARFVTDQFGNATGGIRSPYLDVPVATYYPNSSGQALCRQLGHDVPFDWARLETLYGSSKNYANKVAASVDRLVKERWLTESDGRKIKKELIAPPGK